jgi:hypothetical protein
MSAIGRIPYFDIDRSRFPLALCDEQGYDQYELMGEVVNRLDIGAKISQTLHASDAGWSRIWRRFERSYFYARSMM